MNSGARDYDGQGSVYIATKNDELSLNNQANSMIEDQELVNRINMKKLVGNYYCKIVESDDPKFF